MEPKIRTETVHVEPEEAHDYERKIYCCPVDGCGFEAEDEFASEETGQKKIRLHYGDVHAVKEEREIRGVTFRRFDSTEDLTAYLDARSSNDHIIDGYRLDQDLGPGWYGFEGNEEPCRRGCCSSYIINAYPAVHFELKWEDELWNVSAALDRIKTLTNKE